MKKKPRPGLLFALLLNERFRTFRVFFWLFCRTGLGTGDRYSAIYNTDKKALTLEFARQMQCSGI